MTTPSTSSKADTFKTLTQLPLANGAVAYHSLPKLEAAAGRNVQRLPLGLRVLLENLLRHEDGEIVRREDIEALLDWNPRQTSTYEIQFTPARVLLQDFTGIPVVADLAAMRTALERAGGDATRVNPLQPVDLVIDHSVQVDSFASSKAYEENAELDFGRNGERYEFLKWGQEAFNNFQVVPPHMGICHQVNLEYLAHVAMRGRRGQTEMIYPDTLVGTDSHTPMVNGLGVLGWGVGGIEAEAAMLGQPCSMLIPDVVGFRLTGALKPGVTATDLVLTITQVLRRHGVVGKFVEFTGPGATTLPIAHRATLSNMAPEYGATVGLWPVDERTIEYLRLTGRADRAEQTESYYRAQKMWGQEGSEKVEYTETLDLDLSTVEPSLAGPAKPHDRTSLPKLKGSFEKFAEEQRARGRETTTHASSGSSLKDGSLVIAAITSCTNTSNPSLMLGAALLAKKAVEKGLSVPKHVKTSFAPGSGVVTNYVKAAGLTPFMDQLGFNLVGYGCTTCIGNSGPLPTEIANEIESRHLTVAAVLSGNRNFEARIHPMVRANYLASPPLVVAFALTGRIDVDLTTEPLGTGKDGKPVFLKDIWPTDRETEELVAKHVTAHAFSQSYGSVFDGEKRWQALKAPAGASYDWTRASTYIQRPPFLDPEWTNEPGQSLGSIRSARVLALLGDFITTDHISPAGSIGPATPAGQYLQSLGVSRTDFNSYGARRGNHEVMVRGTFANVRLRNKLVQREGGYTTIFPSGNETTIYDAAQVYRQEGTPLVIIAGKEYGSGSSRDWAAKGTRLLGVRAVIAQSYERIHRSNLVGMGVLPLEFVDHLNAESLGLTGQEKITIENLDALQPKGRIAVKIENAKGETTTVPVIVRIDTPNELRYFKAGGILPYVLRRLAGPSAGGH